MSFKQHFSRFLSTDPERLHAAAHSHHPWPDVTFAAQQQAWLDAARLQDDKWDRVFGEVIPEAQRHVARRLGLPVPASVTFAPNTHELVVRVVSCLPHPATILTTDAEFHSFARQLARWEEAGRVRVERLPASPAATLGSRLATAAGRGGHDLVFFSHVLFDTGAVVAGVPAIVAAVPDQDTLVVIDGYHGFMALPTDLGDLAARAFYTAGGYKYAMAGEGACFLHCPPGYGARPVDTGWFAGFGALADDAVGVVGYPGDARRFLGATFDPTGLYRFNAVQRWLDELGITVEDIHAHVEALQAGFLARVEGLLPAPDAGLRGHFMSFSLPDAVGMQRCLRQRRVVTDRRGDRLRIGFGLYHDVADVDELARRVAAALRG